jgi:hypothetical protein
MTISTMDDLVAAFTAGRTRLRWTKVSVTGGTSGRHVDLFRVAGNASALSTPSSTGRALSVSDGPTFTNPTPPAKTYIGAVNCSGANNFTLAVVDRLVETGGLNGTSGSLQTVNSVALPARAGAGVGVEMWMEAYSDLGSSTPTVTVAYTNAAGGGSSSPAVSVPATLKAGQMFPIPLASGDTGVQSVQSLTLSGTTGTAGNFGITLVKHLAEIPQVSNIGSAFDAFTLGLPEVWDSACLNLIMMPNTATTGIMFLTLDLVQG